MEIKNKVILILANGIKKEFDSTHTLVEINRKYSAGSLFLSSELPFRVDVIDSMTCYSITDHKKQEKKQIKKNMQSIRNLLK